MTNLANTSARVRVIASVDGGGAVSVTTGATVLASGLVSNNNSYVTVAAGAQTTSIRVNGNPVLTSTQNYAAGGDYTVMVYGPAAPVPFCISVGKCARCQR